MTQASGQRILLVEDDPDLTRLVVRVLSGNGGDVVAVQDPHQALQHLRAELSFTRLLTDYKLTAGYSGLDLIVEARRLQPGIGCVLMSGDVGAIDLSGMSERPELLRKPFGVAQLIHTMR